MRGSFTSKSTLSNNRGESQLHSKLSAICCFGVLVLSCLTGCSLQNQSSGATVETFELSSRDIVPLDTASESYLSEMIQRLIKTEGSDALPLVPLLQIARSEQPLALSTPSYSIIISQGLLQRLTNEEELAFVLAHELCHFRLAHFKNRPYRRSSDYALATELEADRCAIEKLLKSNYALHAAPRILAELHGDTTSHLRRLGSERLEALTRIIHYEDQRLWYPANQTAFQRLKRAIQ